MYTVTKQYRTETGHRLTNYEGKCAHLHGHSYLWEVTATSKGLVNGMVVDFKDLKKAMVAILEPLDHAFIVAPDDPLIDIARSGGMPLSDLLRATNGKEPRLIHWEENPTAESFAQWASEMIQQAVPEGITITNVRVWETDSSYAEYLA